MKIEAEKRFKFKVRSESPLLMDNFYDETQVPKNASDSQKAEASAYRCENGNLGLPAKWFKGCLVTHLEMGLPPKTGKDAKAYAFRPFIRAEPFMIDLGIKDYEIYKRTVINEGKLAYYKVSPKIPKWGEIEGVLVVSLEKSDDEIERDFREAGIQIGIGGDRRDGYGRFEVTLFKKIE